MYDENYFSIILSSFGDKCNDAGPAGAGLVDVHGETADVKTCGGNLVEIGKLLDVGVVVVTACDMGFPQDVFVAGLGKFFFGLGEGNVEAGTVYADDFYTLIQNVLHGFSAETRMFFPIVRRAKGLVCAKTDADDVAVAQSVVQGAQHFLYILNGNGLATLFVRHIQDHAATEIPLQGTFIDGS